MFRSISQMDLNLSPAMIQVGKWMAIIGAVGILFMSGRDKKNPFLRLAVPTPMAEPIPARATEIAAPNNAQTIPLIILILLNIYIFCIFAEGVELFSSALKEFAEKLYVL